MNSPSVEKSETFAINIVNIFKYLSSEKNEYVLSKQLLRSGTSIGANIAEGQRAQSKADFCSKMSIALKEASETAYWLTLLYKTDYITEAQYNDLHNSCEELIKILASIVKNTKESIK